LIPPRTSVRRIPRIASFQIAKLTVALVAWLSACAEPVASPTPQELEEARDLLERQATANRQSISLIRSLQIGKTTCAQVEDWFLGRTFEKRVQARVAGLPGTIRLLEKDSQTSGSGPDVFAGRVPTTTTITLGWVLFAPGGNGWPTSSVFSDHPERFHVVAELKFVDDLLQKTRFDSVVAHAAAEDPDVRKPTAKAPPAGPDDPDPGRRFQAVDDAIQSKDPARLATLIAFVNDSDLFVRSRAIQGLSGVHEARAVDALIDRLGDDEQLVRDGAYDSLKKLTRHDVPFAANADPAQRSAAREQWRSWWQESRASFHFEE
jgi:hypothetical protein